MSALTGNQIKDTYQGLLKLEDSSTGITSSFQAVQDGLGNDTGLRIATGQLEAPNIAGFIPLKSQYYGIGLNVNQVGNQLQNGTQNVILATAFQDKGEYSYSALTFNLGTASTTSDTIEAAIYTTQMINPFGLFPYEPIISGLTIPTTGSLGLRTVVFPSNISMSGYGGGIYFLVYKISNGGVQPTVRFGASFTSASAGGFYGLCQNLQNNFQAAGARTNGGLFQVFSGQTTFDAPFGTDLPTKQSTLINFSSSNLGFILHTVDA
jgi:hypothetical protein